MCSGEPHAPSVMSKASATSKVGALNLCVLKVIHTLSQTLCYSQQPDQQNRVLLTLAPDLDLIPLLFPPQEMTNSNNDEYTKQSSLCQQNVPAEHMGETAYQHLGNFPFNTLCSLSAFVVVTRAAGSKQLTSSGYLNGCEESTIPSKEFALCRLHGLTLGAATP